MESFLPSEVARLVLGYLKEINCMRSWETFLQENPSLEEYYLLYKNGKVYCTNVDGKTLLEILNLYRNLTRCKNKIFNEIKRCEKKYNCDPDTEKDIIEEIAGMVSQTFQKYLSLSIENITNMSASNMTSDIVPSEPPCHIFDNSNYKSTNNGCQTDNMGTSTIVTQKNTNANYQMPRITEVYSLSDANFNSLSPFKIVDCSTPQKEINANTLKVNDSSKDKCVENQTILSTKVYDCNLKNLSSDMSNNSQTGDVTSNELSVQSNKSVNNHIFEKCIDDLVKNTAPKEFSPSNYLTKPLASNSYNCDSLSQLMSTLNNGNNLIQGIKMNNSSIGSSQNSHLCPSAKFNSNISVKCNSNKIPALKNKFVHLTNIKGSSAANSFYQLPTVSSIPTYILTGDVLLPNTVPYSCVINSPFSGITVPISSTSNNIHSTSTNIINSLNTKKEVKTLSNPVLQNISVSSDGQSNEIRNTDNIQSTDIATTDRQPNNEKNNLNDVQNSDIIKNDALKFEENMLASTNSASMIVPALPNQQPDDKICATDEMCCKNEDNTSVKNLDEKKTKKGKKRKIDEHEQSTVINKHFSSKHVVARKPQFCPNNKSEMNREMQTCKSYLSTLQLLDTSEDDKNVLSVPAAKDKIQNESHIIPIESKNVNSMGKKTKENTVVVQNSKKDEKILNQRGVLQNCKDMTGMKEQTNKVEKISSKDSRKNTHVENEVLHKKKRSKTAEIDLAIKKVAEIQSILSNDSEEFAQKKTDFSKNRKLNKMTKTDSNNNKQSEIPKMVIKHSTGCEQNKNEEFQKKKKLSKKSLECHILTKNKKILLEDSNNVLGHKNDEFQQKKECKLSNINPENETQSKVLNVSPKDDEGLAKNKKDIVKKKYKLLKTNSEVSLFEVQTILSEDNERFPQSKIDTPQKKQQQKISSNTDSPYIKHCKFENLLPKDSPGLILKKSKKPQKKMKQKSSITDLYKKNIKCQESKITSVPHCTKASTPENFVKEIHSIKQNVMISKPRSCLDQSMNVNDDYWASNMFSQEYGNELFHCNVTSDSNVISSLIKQPSTTLNYIEKDCSVEATQNSEKFSHLYTESLSNEEQSKKLTTEVNFSDSLIQNENKSSGFNLELLSSLSKIKDLVVLPKPDVQNLKQDSPAINYDKDDSKFKNLSSKRNKLPIVNTKKENSTCLIVDGDKGSSSSPSNFFAPAKKIKLSKCTEMNLTNYKSTAPRLIRINFFKSFKDLPPYNVSETLPGSNNDLFTKIPGICSISNCIDNNIINNKIRSKRKLENSDVGAKFEFDSKAVPFSNSRSSKSKNIKSKNDLSRFLISSSFPNDNIYTSKKKYVKMKKNSDTKQNLDVPSFPENSKNRDLEENALQNDNMHTDYKLQHEPYVKLPKLNEHYIHSMTHKSDHIMKENYAACQTGLEKNSDEVPEKNEKILSQSSNESILSCSLKVSIHNFNKFYDSNVKDTVETNIEMSNEQGSKVSLAFTSCEKQLVISHSSNNALSPKNVCATDTLCDNDLVSSDKGDSLSLRASIEKNENTEYPSQWDIIQKAVEKYGCDYILSKISGYLDSEI